MKRLLILLMALALLVVPAMAEEIPADSSAGATSEESTDPVTIDTTTTKEEDGVVVNVTIAQPETAADSSAESGAASSEETAASSLEDLPVVQSFSTLSPNLLAADASGDGSAAMADVITAVFGEYHRQTYTVSHYDSSGNVIATSTEFVPGLAGLDYAWIAGVSLFALVLAGLLRLIGGLLRQCK